MYKPILTAAFCLMFSNTVFANLDCDPEEYKLDKIQEEFIENSISTSVRANGENFAEIKIHGGVTAHQVYKAYLHAPLGKIIDLANVSTRMTQNKSGRLVRIVEGKTPMGFDVKITIKDKGQIGTKSVAETKFELLFTNPRDLARNGLSAIAEFMSSRGGLDRLKVVGVVRQEFFSQTRNGKKEEIFSEKWVQPLEVKVGERRTDSGGIFNPFDIASHLFWKSGEILGAGKLMGESIRPIADRIFRKIDSRGVENFAKYIALESSQGAEMYTIQESYKPSTKADAKAAEFSVDNLHFVPGAKLEHLADNLHKVRITGKYGFARFNLVPEKFEKLKPGGGSVVTGKMKVTDSISVGPVEIETFFKQEVIGGVKTLVIRNIDRGGPEGYSNLVIYEGTFRKGGQDVKGLFLQELGDYNIGKGSTVDAFVQASGFSPSMGYIAGAIHAQKYSVAGLARIIKEAQESSQ